MTVNVLTMGPGTLVIGEIGTTQAFGSQATNVRLVPSVSTGDPLSVLSGEQVAGDRDESFTLAGTLVQDLGAVASTTEWLFAHRGETLPFTFVPNTAGGTSVTGECTVEAIEIGGDVKTKPTSDFEWNVVGTPAIT